MDQQREGWNQYYSKREHTTSDTWLQSYKDYFDGAGSILDLGCGNGSNIPFLLSTGAEISAVDFSENAIMHIQNKWKLKAFVHDMRMPLPFPNDRFDMVLADLSIHYFSMAETTRIVDELYRVMMHKGILIGRVNSITDLHHGAGRGTMIEPNFFESDGVRKRFFDRKMIDYFFDDRFILSKAVERESYKYTRPKKLWEFVSTKAP